jgi:hypothetical protein
MGTANNKSKWNWRKSRAICQVHVTGGSPPSQPQPATIQLLGDIDHEDFYDAIEILQSESRVVASEQSATELIVVAQSRPDAMDIDCLSALRRASPLAGVVALLGSWCEGEARTGQPIPGAHRLYWYEFPAWWHRQKFLRAAGRCPDWCRPVDSGFRMVDCCLSHDLPIGRRPGPGVIILHTAYRETATALADIFGEVGYSTVWQRPDRPRTFIRGAVAGLWDGAQLNDGEARELATFCRHLASDNTPVLVLLDFPRRDRVEYALEIGAAAVLGKPFLNVNLIATLESVIAASNLIRAA